MVTAILSLIDPPGFMFSIFTNNRHGPVSKCFNSNMGVLPIISKMPPKTGASERSVIVEVDFIFQVYRLAIMHTNIEFLVTIAP